MTIQQLSTFNLYILNLQEGFKVENLPFQILPTNIRVSWVRSIRGEASHFKCECDSHGSKQIHKYSKFTIGFSTFCCWHCHNYAPNQSGTFSSSPVSGWWSQIILPRAWAIYEGVTDLLNLCFTCQVSVQHMWFALFENDVVHVVLQLLLWQYLYKMLAKAADIQQSHLHRQWRNHRSEPMINFYRYK